MWKRAIKLTLQIVYQYRGHLAGAHREVQKLGCCGQVAIKSAKEIRGSSEGDKITDVLLEIMVSCRCLGILTVQYQDGRDLPIDIKRTRERIDVQIETLPLLTGHKNAVARARAAMRVSQPPGLVLIR